MDLPEAINILETHNKWRLGAEIPPTEPKLLTEALDIIIKILKRLN